MSRYAKILYIPCLVAWSLTGNLFLMFYFLQFFEMNCRFMSWLAFFSPPLFCCLTPSSVLWVVHNLKWLEKFYKLDKQRVLWMSVILKLYLIAGSEISTASIPNRWSEDQVKKQLSSVWWYKLLWVDARLKTGSTSTKLIGWIKVFLKIGRLVYISWVFFLGLIFAAFFWAQDSRLPIALATEELVFVAILWELSLIFYIFLYLL